MQALRERVRRIVEKTPADDPAEAASDADEAEEMLPEPDSKLVQMLHGCLNPHEEAVMRYRFGFEDGRQHTREETAERFHVTRARILQIERRLLRRRHSCPNRSKLKDYLDD